LYAFRNLSVKDDVFGVQRARKEKRATNYTADGSVKEDVMEENIEDSRMLQGKSPETVSVYPARGLRGSSARAVRWAITAMATASSSLC
jgi:hypothetical protein